MTGQERCQQGRLIGNLLPDVQHQQPTQLCTTARVHSHLLLPSPMRPENVILKAGIFKYCACKILLPMSFLASGGLWGGNSYCGVLACRKECAAVPGGAFACW
jgi:hypothetical protein